MRKTSDKEHTQILLQGSPAVADIDKLYRQESYTTEPSQEYFKMRKELNRDILDNPVLSKWLYYCDDILRHQV